MPASIDFLCVSPAHPPRLLRIGGYVTIVNGGWAYCRAGVDAGHTWRRIEPTALSVLAGLGTTPPTFRGEEVIEDPGEVVPAAATRRGRARANGQLSRNVMRPDANGDLRA